MKKQIRFIALVLSIVMLLDSSMVMSAMASDKEITLINNYVECLDIGNIEEIEELLCEEKK